jgi:hypothetical protein
MHDDVTRINAAGIEVTNNAGTQSFKSKYGYIESSYNDAGASN